ncbi:MAG: hypothetical protein ACRBBR_16990, partial [Cellvibrionaceae bacterium]
RQARKGATVAVTSCAEVWLVEDSTLFYRRIEKSSLIFQCCRTKKRAQMCESAGFLVLALPLAMA